MPSSAWKSTRLNSSHTLISYAVFCLEKHTSELQSHSHLVCRLLLEKPEQPESVHSPLRCLPQQCPTAHVAFTAACDHPGCSRDAPRLGRGRPPSRPTCSRGATGCGPGA